MKFPISCTTLISSNKLGFFKKVDLTHANWNSSDDSELEAYKLEISFCVFYFCFFFSFEILNFS